MSKCYFNGSILSLIDPSKTVESCIIIVIDSLNYLSDNALMSTLSISIYPCVPSNILKLLKVIVDFPAPVLPTMATFSPAYTVKFIFFKTSGKPSLY